MTPNAAAHTFEVDTLGDDVADGECLTDCYLRDAFQLAAASNDADTDQITFQSGLSGTIALTVGELPAVDEPLNLAGPGANVLTISGSNNSRIIRITGTADTPVAISGLGLTAGRVAGDTGAAITSNEGALTLRNVTISGNNAVGVSFGGGIFASNAPLTVDRSTISGNSAHQGAGLWAQAGAVTVSRSTVSGNTAGGVGGGIVVRPQGTLVDPRTAEIQSSTITGNTAGTQAGGVLGYDAFPDPTLANTIVANNSAPSAPDVHDAGDGLNSQFSLIENTSGATIQNSVAGSNHFGVDPQLGPLAANGGPTRTHALLPTSPAIDKGSAPGPDQRGFARPVDFPGLPNSTAFSANGADIGAFELQRGTCRGQLATLPLVGKTLNDVIVGTPGRDVIRALAGRDIVCGLGGNDLIIGGGAKDILLGQGGKDKLKGSGGNDRLIGGAGRDKLIGGSGRDKLNGGPGRDKQVQ